MVCVTLTYVICFDATDFSKTTKNPFSIVHDIEMVKQNNQRVTCVEGAIV